MNLALVTFSAGVNIVEVKLIDLSNLSNCTSNIISESLFLLAEHLH